MQITKCTLCKTQKQVVIQLDDSGLGQRRMSNRNGMGDAGVANKHEHTLTVKRTEK
jgi:hypothetical protein